MPTCVLFAPEGAAYLISHLVSSVIDIEGFALRTDIKRLSLTY